MMAALPRRCLLVLIGCSLFPSGASAQEPLSVRVDRLMEAGQIGPSTTIANDAEFLRRVSLDLSLIHI